MATTTISDLPRDMLVSIFRIVFDPAHSSSHLRVHKDVRRVSHEWRDAADIACIEHQKNHVHLIIDEVRDPASLRARYPSMVHALTIYRTATPRQCQAPIVALAMPSLCASPDLRRVLKRVCMQNMCCAAAAAAAVSAIAACANLTSLDLRWRVNEHGDGVGPDMLAPLTALTGLKELAMRSGGAWPALPDVPSLSSLELTGIDSTSFAPVGGDASMGRLRRLSLFHRVTVGENDLWASDDPFYLRAGLDAGTWRSHLLTHMQDLRILMTCDSLNDLFRLRDWEPPVFEGAAPAEAVWAPLAATVTNLELDCKCAIYGASDLETGMYAGLGMLTGLQALVVRSSSWELMKVRRYPVDFGRVHLPHLTSLSARGYRGPPIDVARFPRLVHVEVESANPEPLVLSSVAALRRLALLRVARRYSMHEAWRRPRLNLAQLFGGGRPLAALTELSFDRVALAWDATAVAGAPTAPEFAARAGTLLPSLRSLEIKEDVEMDESVREFVLPALLALGRG